MKIKLTRNQILLSGIALLALFGISSCIPLLAGAAVGYVAHDEGYRVENPIKKAE